MGGAAREGEVFHGAAPSTPVASTEVHARHTPSQGGRGVLDIRLLVVRDVRWPVTPEATIGDMVIRIAATAQLQWGWEQRLLAQRTTTTAAMIVMGSGYVPGMGIDRGTGASTGAETLATYS